MAEQSFRINIIAAQVPCISTNYGRSVLIKDKADTHYISANAYGGVSSDLDFGIPQVIYQHNILPTMRGSTSLQYTSLVAALPSGAVATECFHLQTCDDSRMLFCPTATGNYLYGMSGWVDVGGHVSSAPVTSVHLHKTTYFLHEYESLQVLDEGTNTLMPSPLVGIDITKVKGVCKVNNYLILYTKDTIHWSSPIVSEDFTPELDTTAGSIIPNDLRGAIVFCCPYAGGMYIFTTVNVIKAAYTGDTRFQFKFTEVLNSGGIESKDTVAWEANADTVYFSGTKGIQAIGISEGVAQSTHTEISDFLDGHQFEDYIGEQYKTDHSNVAGTWSSESQAWSADVGYNQLYQIFVEARFKRKVSLVSSRYLCFSYGIEELTHSLVFDVVLRRWGKLRIPHVQLFELSPANTTVDYIESKHALGVLKASGEIMYVNTDATHIAEDSVIIFGRVQYVRNRVLTCTTVELENTFPTRANLTILNSLDGKTWQPGYFPMQQIATKTLTRWLGRITGISQCFKFAGTFEICSIVGTAILGGRR